VNSTEQWLLQPEGLASQIRRLRENAGLTGSALAGRLGWIQPKISKIENGKQIPSEDDIHALANALDADEATTEILLDLQRRAGAISREWRRSRRDGQEAIQQDYDEMVKAATVIRNAEVNTIPGLLQTPEYARHQALQAVTLHDFDPAGIDATVTARIRRQEVLYDTTKRFEFVITEASLRLLMCPPDAMLAQLDRLLGVTFLRPNFWFGIIPFGVELQTVPQNRFMILDNVVLVEHFAGDEAYRADRAATYAKAMDLLMAEAVTEESARERIVEAMAALRKGLAD
jgi:transcriptional regulator with XRE-family HTH domain